MPTRHPLAPAHAEPVLALTHAAGSSEAELLIYGDIGDSWYGESVTARSVVEQLQNLDAGVTDIIARINSYGGSVSDGLAIHNALRRHKASVTVVVDGVAVSSASLIAMAGDTVQMGENALMMIHAPWTIAAGNSATMRKSADVLDKYAQAMTSSYVRKSGKSAEEVMSMLTDGEDHWYTAQEAVDEGFADEVTDAGVPVAAADMSRIMERFSPAAAAAAFGLDLGKLVRRNPPTNTPAAAAAQPLEAPKMPKHDNAPAAPEQSAEIIDIQNAARSKRDEELKARNSAIRTAFSPFAARAGVSELMADMLADPDITAEQAQAKLLAKLGEGSEPLAGEPAMPGEDERDKFVTAAETALIVRAGVHRLNGSGMPAMRADMNGNPFRGQTLLDMARACLRRAGKNPDGLDKRDIVGQAFQTTSDFPVLLENTIHKMLQRAYMAQPDTWSRFCRTGEVSDFRAHNRYRVGSIGNFDTLTEHGEFKRKTIPDGEKSSITASTKGNIIAVTREVIINDDLQALADLATNMGRAGRRTIEAAVYALLAENSGLGPTLTADSKTLFHADHGNLVATGSGAAPSVTTLEAARAAMASQLDVGGNDYLDLRPSIWLGPLGLGGDARVINDSQYDPDTANKLQKPNKVRGLFRDVVDTPRLSGAPWYVFADPEEAPSIEVAFLDGVQEPYVETQNGWNVDGAELKARLDFGVAGIDYRGAYLNQGA